MMQLRKRHAWLSPSHVMVICAVIAVFPGRVAFSQSSTTQLDVCTASKGLTDAATFAEADACFTKALEAAERERGVLLARIRKAIDAQEEVDLVRADNLWVQYRDATCMAEWRLYLGPLGGSVAETACLVAETRSRTASLTRTYGSRLKSAGE
jgi:uncharacterized protein YecT (DUF1311 family)